MTAATLACRSGPPVRPPLVWALGRGIAFSEVQFEASTATVSWNAKGAKLASVCVRVHMCTCCEDYGTRGIVCVRSSVACIQKRIFSSHELIKSES